MSAPACIGQSAEMKPPVPDARTALRQQLFVEIVDDRFEISRGLMCRDGMAENWGMLFFMEREQIQRFWMKNTLIPLDMVFIDRNWRVVGVVEDTEPLSLMSPLCKCNIQVCARAQRRPRTRNRTFRK